MSIFYLKKRDVCLLLLLSVASLSPLSSLGQVVGGELTLEKTIELAKVHSTQAKVARFSLLSQYWSFRSYKANLLPSVDLSGELFDYDRSIKPYTNSSGEVKYNETHTLYNELELAIKQQIPLTGGTVSLGSTVSRLDQFLYDKTNYSSFPVNFKYTQPLRAFNTLKWQKKTAPRQYENAKKKYLETMESITIKATSYYFAVLSAQSEYTQSLDDYQKRKELFEVAERRYELGTLNYSELLQLKLTLLNAEMRINTALLDLDSDIFTLSTYIGVPKSYISTLQLPLSVPNVSLNYEDVLDKAFSNSSHTLTQELLRITSEQALAKAKSQRGLQATVNVNLGLSQADPTISGVYRDLKDREIVGLTFSLPIFDWGVSSGAVRTAEADLEVTLAEIEIANEEFRQDIQTKVLQFNNQKRQCEIAIMANDIAKERYDITTRRFENGTGSVTVTHLNTARIEYESAQAKYIAQLKTFWSYYFEIQQLSLYNFIDDKNISAQFDELIK